MTDRGFIFDLDGVVVDTAKYHYLAWNKLAQQLGFEFTEKHNELLKGVSRRTSLDILLDIGGVDTDEAEKEVWMETKNTDYLGYIRKMTPEEILPKAQQVIQEIKDLGYKVALGSASKNASEILNRIGLFDDFDVIVDGTHVSKAKPDPEVFLKAAAQMGVQPQNCLVFEDAVAGIEAAKNAGMIAIGIGDQKTLSQADVVFKDFTEMPNGFLNEIFSKMSITK